MTGFAHLDSCGAVLGRRYVEKHHFFLGTAIDTLPTSRTYLQNSTSHRIRQTYIYGYVHLVAMLVLMSENISLMRDFLF
jgi:hypothetical protein